MTGQQKKQLRSKANYGILEGFLTTLLGKKIKIKSIVDSKSNKEAEYQKYKRYYNWIDILAEENDSLPIIVEIQFTSEMDYLYRKLFGSGKSLAEHLDKKVPYSEIKKVYSVDIVYFNLGIGKDYIYHGTANFKGLHYGDELGLSQEQKEEFGKLEAKDICPEFYILKVDRFNNEVTDKLDEWIYFLKNDKIEPNFDAPGLAKANKELDYVHLSYEEQLVYDRYVDLRRSDKSTIYTARVEGEDDRKAHGIEYVRTKIAKEMIAEGTDIDLISKVTKLSKEDIEDLCPNA